MLNGRAVGNPVNSGTKFNFFEEKMHNQDCKMPPLDPVPSITIFLSIESLYN
jgi:hypothetical protein